MKSKFTVLKARGKSVLADVICYCKMTSVMALDGATLFILLKDVTSTCKCMRHSRTIGGNSSLQWWKVEESEDFKCVFVFYCVLKSK